MNGIELSRENNDRHEWKDRYSRLRADFENYKRNALAEKKRLAGIGREAVLNDIFPLVEHMERALKAAGADEDSSGILKGLEMVYEELLRVLEKHGVERIMTVGEPFNPQVHEAVDVMMHPEYQEDTVVEEVTAGFMKAGKLLRPAAVIVAKDQN